MSRTVHRVHVPLVAGSSDIMAHVVVNFDAVTLGCHACVINSVAISVSVTPPLEGFGSNFEGIRKGISSDHPYIKATMSEEEYKALRGSKTSYSLKDLPESSQKELWEGLLTKIRQTHTGGTYIFAPVVNYNTVSRGESGMYYRTAQLVEAILKYGGGDVWGLPMMVNPVHTPVWNGGLSLFQIVVWQVHQKHPYAAQNPALLSPIKGTRFERHETGGRYGVLRTATQVASTKGTYNPRQLPLNERQALESLGILFKDVQPITSK